MPPKAGEASLSEENTAKKNSYLLDSFKYYAAAVERARFEEWPEDKYLDRGTRSVQEKTNPIDVPTNCSRRSVRAENDSEQLLCNILPIRTVKEGAQSAGSQAGLAP